MSENVSEKIEIFLTLFETFEKKYGEDLTEESYPKSKNIISNSKLLIPTLIDFYRDRNKSDYFPAEITSAILSKIQTMVGFLNTINPAPDSKVAGVITAITELLKNLDNLYSYALQYGLITFGFTPKEIQKKLQEFVEAQNKIKDYSEKADAMFLKLEMSSKKIEENEGAGKKIISFLEEQKNKVTPIPAEVEIISKAIGAEKAAVLDEKSKVLAMVKEVSDLKESSKNQFAKVTEFFSEIEKYKNEMIDVKKESNANITALKEQENKQVTDYSGRTETIIAENEKLQKDINEHLRNAISVSLFKSFDTRTDMLKGARELWMKYLTGSVILGIVVGMWIFGSVASSQHLDVIFFARFVLAFPVGYFVYFCGKQYTNERRAEEEYAFKSAISLSLESYLDLIKRKGGNAELGVGYIKELIYEIFDNPVKRLYFEEEGKKELGDLDVIFKNIEKMGKGINVTADEAQKLAESLKRIIKLT